MITSVTKVYYDNVHVAYDMVKNGETSSVPLDEAIAANTLDEINQLLA